MSIFVSLLGLGVPDPDPRGGPLLRRPRRRDEPAQVLSRLPARGRQDEAKRDRVRRRGDPARRLREDPRHAPAGGGRPRRPLRPRDRGGARRSAGRSGTCAVTSRRTTTPAPVEPSSASGPHFPTPRSRRSHSARPSAGCRRSRTRSRRTRTGGRRHGSGSPSSSPGRPRTSSSPSSSSPRSSCR